ncbi:MAG: hypothetical protein ACQETH_09140 [Candidatus Rifleibacteriota bacterium]
MKFWHLQKKPAMSEDSLTKLLQDALVGGFFSTMYFLEYLLVWFVAYPVLMFGVFFLMQTFLGTSLDEASLIFWFNLMLALGAVFYFGHKLLLRFVATRRTSEEYAQSRYNIRLEVILFMLVNFAGYYTMNIRIFEMIKYEPIVLFEFKIFFAIYLMVLFVSKKYYDKYLR